MGSENDRITGALVEPVYMKRQDPIYALTETEIDVMLLPDEHPDTRIMNVALAVCSASASGVIAALLAKQWMLGVILLVITAASGYVVKVCWPKEPEINQMKEKLADRIKNQATS